MVSVIGKLNMSIIFHVECAFVTPQQPSSENPQFLEIRAKFKSTFSQVEDVIKTKHPSLEEMKRSLQNHYFHLTQHLTNITTIAEFLNISTEKCSLIDIRCLEVVIDQFCLKNIEQHFEDYKCFVNEFCCCVSVYSCLNETFDVVVMSTSLKCETLKFFLNWKPSNNYRIKDATDLLFVSFGELAKNVKLITLTEDISLILTCTFPYNLRSSLIVKAHENLESMKRKGVIKLTIADFCVFDEDSGDDVRV